MSSYNSIVVIFTIILVNENLFCYGYPGLYLRRYNPNHKSQCECDYQNIKLPIPEHKISKREQPQVTAPQSSNSGFQLPAIAYPTKYYQPINSGIQPFTTYPSTGIHQPILYQPNYVHRSIPQPVLHNNVAQPDLTSIHQQYQPKINLDAEYIKTISTQNKAPPVNSKAHPLINKLKNQTSSSQENINIAPSTLNTGYVQPVMSYPQIGLQTPATQYQQIAYPSQKSAYLQSGYFPQISNPQMYGSFATNQHLQYPAQNVLTPETSYETSFNPDVEYTQPGTFENYKNYILTRPEYIQDIPGNYFYPYGNENVKIYPFYSFSLPKVVHTSKGDIQVELIDVMPYKPGTEPEKRKPKVDSIDSTIIENESKEVVEFESTETVTQVSKSSWFK